MIHSDILLDLRKHRRAAFPHLPGIPLHDAQVGPDGLGEVGLVDDQQVALGDAGPSLAGDLVAARDVDDVDDVVCQLPAVVRGEVVPAALDEQQVGVELCVQVLEGGEVGADVLAHGGVGAAARLDGADALGGQGAVARQELGVLAREDVVGDGGDVVPRAQGVAQRQHQRRLARADGPADADREGARGPLPALGYGHLAADIGARPVEDLVRVAVLLGVEAAVVRVRVRG